MKNLEMLLKAKEELDKILKVVEVEQLKMQDEIKAKKNIGWEKMFDDLYSLKKYSNFIDTGICLYGDKIETLGFEIRDNFICVISWKHFDKWGNKIEDKQGTYFFTIKKDSPFQAKSGNFADWMKFVVVAIEDWDNVMDEIKIRLAKKMELDMGKSISNSSKKQTELENQLKSINKRSVL